MHRVVWCVHAVTGCEYTLVLRLELVLRSSSYPKSKVTHCIVTVSYTHLTLPTILRV